MEIFRFHFNMEYARELRDAVNDRPKQSLENIHKEIRAISGEYYAWNRTCAAMDRLEDTLDYLNHMELGRNRRTRSAFDFYDFINNAFIVIDCIKTIGEIFRIDNALIEEIENSTSAFGDNLMQGGTDQRYFEYIRSLCSVHPLCTNHQKEFLNGDKLHCCPYVSWNTSFSVYGNGADLVAIIYPADYRQTTIYLRLYISQFEQYIEKWIDFIPEIIKAKNTYTDREYERLRIEPIKYLSAFDNDIVKWMLYLKSEYCKRFDDGNDYILDNFIPFFTITLSDSYNNFALEKYQNAIRYALGFFRNELQNMSYEGFENSGAFSQHSYVLQKVHYLKSNEDCYEYERCYARNLLEEPKELINEYVHFTNTEPDEERMVLVRLALYLEALTRKCLLNRNIPNTLEYRLKVLTDEQYADLFIEERSNKDRKMAENAWLEFLENHGGLHANI